MARALFNGRAVIDLLQATLPVDRTADQGDRRPTREPEHPMTIESRPKRRAATLLAALAFVRCSGRIAGVRGARRRRRDRRGRRRAPARQGQDRARPALRGARDRGAARHRGPRIRLAGGQSLRRGLERPRKA